MTAEVGCQGHPGVGSDGVVLHSPAVFIAAGRGILCLGVSLLGCFAEPRYSLFEVSGDAYALGVQDAELGLRQAGLVAFGLSFWL